MKKTLLCIAALAAITLTMPAAAAIATVPEAASSAVQVREHAHIRTVLYGQKGPAVVLIPGMSTPGAVWDDTVHALAGTHRLLVVEVRGFDGKPAPENTQDGLLDGIVANLASDLDARGLSDATIVGHSMGGLIALKVGLAHASMARQLLVVDALPFFGTVFDGNATLETIKPRAVQMRDMMIGSAAMMRAAADQARRAPSADCGKGMVLNPAAACKVRLWSLSADPAVTAQAVYEDMLTDLRKDIGGLKMPVTVLYQATIDPKVAADRYETDYAALKSARLVPVDRTGHFIMLDRPELFRAELEALTR